MKKNIWLIAMLSVLTIWGQNALGESNNIALVQSPGSLEDGYSFGINYEYQNRTVYVGPELYIFPNLNGYDYAHLMGRIGFNKEWKQSLRIFTGIRLGIIYRETGGMQYANIGGEIGGQYTFKNGLFARVAGSVDEATDSQLWSNKDSFTRRSVWISIGKRF